MTHYRRRSIVLALLIASLCPFIAAQTTTVTGTSIDPNGV